MEDADEPKYTPTVFGGSGGVAPFTGCSNHKSRDEDLTTWNMYLALGSYKSGTYTRVYGSAINECHEAIRRYEIDGKPVAPILAPRLRWKQEYLHGTYHDRIHIPRINIRTPGEPPPVPLYRASGAANLLISVERRLQATRRVSTRRDAEVEYAQKSRLNSYLVSFGGIRNMEAADAMAKRQATKEFEGALRANSAFQSLLRRSAAPNVESFLNPDDFITMVGGVRELDLGLCRWIVRGGKGEVLTIYDFYSPDDMYVTDEVSSENTLKIPGVTVRPLVALQSAREQTTITKLGLWQISESQEQWADNLVDQLIAARSFFGGPIPRRPLLDLYMRNREWVSDDSLIIEEASRAVADQGPQLLMLVSKDIRLGNQLAASTGCPVLRFKPQSIVQLGLREVYNSSTKFDVNELERIIPRGYDLPPGKRLSVYTDTGSLESAACNFAPGRRGDPQLLICRPPLNSSIHMERGAVRRLYPFRGNLALRGSDIQRHYPPGRSSRPLARVTSYVADPMTDPMQYYSDVQ